jgi:hypothetical protein
MPIIPALRRLKQEDLEFKANLSKKLTRYHSQQTSQARWYMPVIPAM